MSLFTHIKSILEQNENFAKDGEVFKNKVVEAALKLEPSLISILLKDDRAKSTFFQEIESIMVFDKIKFQKFISNKEFLPNSFTEFKNKIGLTANREYLTEAKEVVLDFPYKDCILEGGQTKENQKRQEIFWNETLAPDEIDRLFEPKVLTNWKRYDKDGEHEVNSISLDDNLIVKGNNLIALHSLKKVYKGKVKLIYIDPPYNTGNDSFQYNDSFNHSTWLTFMKNRLEVAKKLLSDDGLIFVQCDDNEQAYLKVLMDAIFKRENFIATILYRRRKSQANLSKNISPIHDYIICFGKTSNSNLNKITPNLNEDDFKNPDNDPRGKYTTMPCTNGGGAKYSITTPTGKIIEDEWRFKYETYKALEKDNRLVFPNSGNGKPRYKLFMSEKLEKGIVPNTWWDDVSSNQEATREIKALFGKDIFSFPKAEKLIERILELGSNKGDLVLDFHLGSGTTCAVAHKMGRRFIGIEQMDYVKDITVQRLVKVIKGEEGGISESQNWKGGGSFIYCELAENTQAILTKIKDAKPGELSNMWNALKNSPYVSYKVDFRSVTDEDFIEKTIEDKKEILKAILDKNTLYIPFSELDSSDFAINIEDKQNTYYFYGNN